MRCQCVIYLVKFKGNWRVPQMGQIPPAKCQMFLKPRLGHSGFLSVNTTGRARPAQQWRPATPQNHSYPSSAEESLSAIAMLSMFPARARSWGESGSSGSVSPSDVLVSSSTNLASISLISSGLSLAHLYQMASGTELICWINVLDRSRPSWEASSLSCWNCGHSSRRCKGLSSTPQLGQRPAVVAFPILTR